MTDQAIDNLNTALTNLKIQAKATRCEVKGPLQRFYVELDGSVRISNLDKYSQEIAMAMRAAGEPLILPNKVDGVMDGTVRLDVMTGRHPVVPFLGLVKGARFLDPEVLSGYNLPWLIGVQDIDVPVAIDLTKSPHALIAGETGSGKSMCLHTAFRSFDLMADKLDVRLALIDTKLVEFGLYGNAHSLRYSIANSIEEAVKIIEDLIDTMNSRLDKMAKAGCRDIIQYRSSGKKMPFIVLLIDELADLMRDKKSGFAENLCSLAAKSRAAGIHIIAATQHPSRDVLTGLLKAQFPTRIGFRVGTHTYSRMIIDETGSEKLIGSGDGLLKGFNGDLVRFQGALVDPTMPFKKRRKRHKKKLAKPKKQNTGDVSGILLNLLNKTISGLK